MSMLDWAKREVDIACKKECPDNEDGHWDYGCACYESALKAFSCLIEDNHSGFSIQITKNILNKLIEGKPLSPITDDDFFISNVCCGVEESEAYLKENGLKSSLQCPRMSSLFREEYLDGTVKYTDVGRIVCKNVGEPDISYYSNRGKVIVDEMFPISMPYNAPNKPYTVITDECLVNSEMGDWDTEAIYEIITPEGEHIPINKFYKYTCVGKVEITKEEFNERKKING